jgi:3-oxoacyl-[acyl-carrier protein] reductase
MEQDKLSFKGLKRGNNMDLGLKNLKALVTGASKGLGFAAASLLAAEGAQIVINSRDAKVLEQAALQIKEDTGADAIAIAGDVSKTGQPEKLVEAAAQKMGGLDILITNGGGPRTGKFASLDDSAWAEAVDLCLMNHVRLIRAALPYLEASRAASVLTVTSISAKQPIPDLILSNTLRAGVLGLTKSLALELGGKQIRFNSILPGWTATQRAVDLIQSRADNNQTSLEDELKKQAAATPLGRIARPEEFARVAVFLVSPASSYLTGTMISVDGGSYKALL